EELNGGRLAGAVGAEIANQLASIDAKADPIDRMRDGVLACKQRPQGAQESGLPFRCPKFFADPLDLDQGHGTLQVLLRVVLHVDGASGTQHVRGGMLDFRVLYRICCARTAPRSRARTSAAQPSGSSKTSACGS